MRIKCLWYSQNACIFKFHYFGEGTSQQAPPANFSKVNFNYKTQKITIHVNAYPKCTKKYIEVNEWALRVAGSRYILEHNAPFISISTRFLELAEYNFTSPSSHLSHHGAVATVTGQMARWSVQCSAHCWEFSSELIASQSDLGLGWRKLVLIEINSAIVFQYVFQSNVLHLSDITTECKRALSKLTLQMQYWSTVTNLSFSVPKIDAKYSAILRK